MDDALDSLNDPLNREGESRPDKVMVMYLLIVTYHIFVSFYKYKRNRMSV